MKFNEYIPSALKTMSNGDEIKNRIIPRTATVHAAMGLSTEANEILDAVKKHVFYGKELSRKNLIEEIGDLIWYLAVLVHFEGLPDIESILDANIEKLKKRYGEKFDSEKAINRDVEKELEHIKE